MTKVEQEMVDLMESILDKKEEIEIIESDLDSLKTNLLSLMQANHKVEINTKFARAKVISFGRESLKKDEVLFTLNQVNKGVLDGKINICELIKRSPVCFVLVKAKE